jgi:hypothetical protein
MIFRIAVVCSVLWFLVALANIKPWEYRWDRVDEFIGVTIIPLVILWGIWWIIKGRKKKR